MQKLEEKLQQQTMGKIFPDPNMERRINEAIETSGSKKAPEISRITGIPYRVVWKYSPYTKIELRHYKSVERGYEDIRKAMESGASSMDELVEAVGLAPSTIIRYGLHAGIELPDCKSAYKRRKDVDKLIEEGLSLVQMVRRVESWNTNESARRYLINTGQHEGWKERRKKKREDKVKQEEEKKLRSNLLNQLSHNLLALAISRLSFEWRKALEYHLVTRGRTSYSVESLVDLFREFRYLHKRDGKVSIPELFSRTRIVSHYQDIYRIFEKVGINIVNRKPYTILTNGEKRILKKEGNSLKIGSSGIAYFWNTVPKTISKYLENHERAKRPLGNYSKGSWREISQIFEAADLGLNPEEISELLEINKMNINKVLGRREELSETIIDSLDILYPNQEHIKPYLIK